MENDAYPIPSGYRIRPARSQDVAAVARLVNEALMRDVGLRLVEPDELARQWASSTDLDLVVIVDAHDLPIAFASLEIDETLESIYLEGVVDQSHEGQGLGGALVAHAERRAGSLSGTLGGTVTLSTDVNNDRARELMDRAGFKVTSGDIAMFKDLARDLPQVTWPPGVRLRPYREDADDALMYDVMRAGFGDDWRPQGPAQGDDSAGWIAGHREAPGYHPDLWLFAERDGEVIGAILCREQWHGADRHRLDKEPHGAARPPFYRYGEGATATCLSVAQRPRSHPRSAWGKHHQPHGRQVLLREDRDARRWKFDRVREGHRPSRAEWLILNALCSGAAARRVTAGHRRKVVAPSIARAGWTLPSAAVVVS
ncbi:MAG: GNAT family N-acetyltransferase [Actinomycetota bacterium]|nr:GNAT family N-acetyltransferase [Actinomycetota bacterium]